MTAWGKHQRKDVKRPSWFALDNRIFEDPKLFDLTDTEWKVFLYVLCQASLQQCSRPKIYFVHALKVCGLKKDAILSALIKLDHANVTSTSRTSNADVTLQDKTRQTRQDKQDNNAHAEAFALFWAKYPRKVGKGKSEIIYRRNIAVGEDPEKILAAVARYKEHLKKEGTEEKYILHGPTFLARWRDFLDPDFGKTENFSASARADLTEIFKPKEPA